MCIFERVTYTDILIESVDEYVCVDAYNHI